MFALHIWGPAFGLPSIDAECIAASAYINQLLPQDQWTLVLANDPSQSPTGDFPALQHASTWVGGFSAIVEFMASKGFSLDSDLAPRKRAESTAIRAHLSANAVPLLDAALYTSSSNYESITRPAWTKILPAHANLIIPPHRHSFAKSRTLPLGLASGSVDDLPSSDFSPQQQQEARMLSSSPSLLFKRRQTLQDALKVQQSQTLFRLESLTDALMGPLASILNGNEYMLSSKNAGPTSIDCLIFGYLSLFLYPDLPNAWVAETIRKKFKTMTEYVDRLRTELLPGGPVVLDIVLQAKSLDDNIHNPRPSKQETSLPWRTASPPNPASVFKALSNSLFSNTISPLQQHFIFDSDLITNGPPTSLRSWTSPLTLFLTLSTPILATLSYLLYIQTHLGKEQDKRFGRSLPRLQGLGAAGAALSVLGNSPRENAKFDPVPGEDVRSKPSWADTEDLINESKEKYDGEAKQRHDQDTLTLSGEPGVGVEVGIKVDNEAGSRDRDEPRQ